MLASFIFLSLKEPFAEIGFLFLRLVLLILFLRLGVILHEIGHHICALVVGFTPRKLILGTGHQLLSFKLWGVRIILNSKKFNGTAFVSYGGLNFLKLKSLLFCSGGLLANLAICLLAYKIGGFNIRSIYSAQGIDPATLIILSNSYLILISLIPYSTTVGGIQQDNDGLRLLKIPFQKIDKLKAELSFNEVSDALEYIDDKEYNKAAEILENYLSRFDDNKVLHIILGLCYAKQGDYSRAIDLFNSIQSYIDDSKYEKSAYIYYNGLAWYNLITDNLEKADFYSLKAYEKNRHSNPVVGTRGSVLVLMGKIQEGIDMLKPLSDFKFANSQTLSASIVLGYAYYMLGEEKLQQKHINHVAKNTQFLDIDEKQLWENIQTRMNSTKSPASP